MKMRSFALLDESAPIDVEMKDRDGYAQTKLMQENLVVECSKKNNWRWTVLRPGMIYGRDNLFNARIGMKGNRWWIRTGAWARIPLTYVSNCAEAIVLACEREQANGQFLNVVDDEMPTQRRYSRLLQRNWNPRPHILPISWTAMRAIAWTATATNRWLLGNRAKVPGIFIPSRLYARCRPLRYSNARIKEVLGWRPTVSLNDAVQKSLHPPTKLEPQMAAMVHAFGRD
jgi:nucleoside-diphosphate-sugar epimerase